MGEQDETRLHRAIVVALLSAIPYGIAACGMIVRPWLPHCSLFALSLPCPHTAVHTVRLSCSLQAHTASLCPQVAQVSR